MQDVRIVQEDEIEQYLNKWSIQKEFAPNLQERADDVSRGENNVNGELKVAGETKKQTCDTSNSCWEEIPLDDSNDHDIPSESGSQISFEVATTSPSPSVKAAKEMQDNADEALHRKFRMFNLFNRCKDLKNIIFGKDKQTQSLSSPASENSETSEKRRRQDDCQLHEDRFERQELFAPYNNVHERVGDEAELSNYRLHTLSDIR